MVSIAAVCSSFAKQQTHHMAMLLIDGMALNIASVDRIHTSYQPIVKVSLVYL